MRATDVYAKSTESYYGAFRGVPTLDLGIPSSEAKRRNFPIEARFGGPDGSGFRPTQLEKRSPALQGGGRVGVGDCSKLVERLL